MAIKPLTSPFYPLGVAGGLRGSAAPSVSRPSVSASLRLGLSVPPTHSGVLSYLAEATGVGAMVTTRSSSIHLHQKQLFETLLRAIAGRKASSWVEIWFKQGSHGY